MTNVANTWNKILDETFLGNFNDLYDDYDSEDCNEDELIVEFQYRVNGNNLYVKVTDGIMNTELCYMNTSIESETDTPEEIVQSLYDDMIIELKENDYFISDFTEMPDAFTRDGFRVLQVVVILEE